MSFEHYRMSDVWASVLEKMDYFFVVIFSVEILLKLFALRNHYFKNGWNIFDVAVLILTVMPFIFEDVTRRYYPVPPALLRVVRYI